MLLILLKEMDPDSKKKMGRITVNAKSVQSMVQLPFFPEEELAEMKAEAMKQHDERPSETEPVVEHDGDETDPDVELMMEEEAMKQHAERPSETEPVVRRSKRARRS